VSRRFLLSSRQITQSYPLSKLVVTMLAVNQNAGPGEGTVWFDYFDVQGNPASAPGINTNQSENNPNNSNFPIGTVVGAVMGGLALLVAIVGLVSYLRWKRRRSGYTRTSAQNVFDGKNVGFHLPGWITELCFARSRQITYITQSIRRSFIVQPYCFRGSTRFDH